MNTIKKIALITALFFAMNTYGQNTLTINGDTIASISSSGILTDVMNQQIGEITTNGEVKNSQGQIIGNTVGNVFKNASGKAIATKRTINGVTELVQLGNIVIATIQNGNRIIGSNGTVLITSSGSTNETQLLIYFLYF